MQIYNKDKVIGRVSLNRIFVEDIEGVGIWVDEEAPNSMQISSQICKKDFKNVEGRFIGIIDELIFNDDKYEDLAQYIISMVYGLIYNLNCNFKIYYLYTQPKSANKNKYNQGIIDKDNLIAYEQLGFKVVDEDRSILRHNIWRTNKSRKKFNMRELEEIYLP